MIHRDLRGELQAYNFHISFAHWSSTWYKHSYSTWEWGFGWSLTALSLAAAGNEVRVYAIRREIMTSCLWRCNHRPKASCVHASMRYAYRRAHSVELFINRSREEGRRRWVLDVRQSDTRASMLRTEVVHWGGTRGLQVPQSWGDPLQWSFNLGTPHPPWDWLHMLGHRGRSCLLTWPPAMINKWRWCLLGTSSKMPHEENVEPFPNQWLPQFCSSISLMPSSFSLCSWAVLPSSSPRHSTLMSLLSWLLVVQHFLFMMIHQFGDADCQRKTKRTAKPEEPGKSSNREVHENSTNHKMPNYTQKSNRGTKTLLLCFSAGNKSIVHHHLRCSLHSSDYLNLSTRWSSSVLKSIHIWSQ